MATLTIPAKFKNMTEAEYDDYVCFLAANCCQKCDKVEDLSRNHETNLWVCEACDAEIIAGIEAAMDAAELAAAAAPAECQNCGAIGRTFQMGETAADSWHVCDVCAEDYKPAPAIARKAPAAAPAAVCCNCQIAPARWNSIYCGDACRRAFLTFDYSGAA